MGDRGRLVIPAELRARLGLSEGTPLVLVDTAGGVVVLNRDQLKAMVRADVSDVDLVGSLLEDRRRQAAEDDAA
jgi:AbrB family looped-hinge helix DNA binding protein